MKDSRLKVLITGAAGFVGRYTAKEFSDSGYKVIGMGWGKFPDHAEWNISSWYETDISLEALCEFGGEPDVIVHCAGGSSVGYSVEHPRQDFCLTVDTTSHVLEYIRLYSPATRMVYPSSAAVYGQVKVTPLSEESPFNPVSPYGVHKLMAESLCKMYAGRYGLSISIVRLFSIYGDGLKKQLLWDACIKLSQGHSTFFGSGEEERDWLHITDTARLLKLASEHSTLDCPIANGGTGFGLKVRDILQCLTSSMNVKIEPHFSSVHKDGDPNVLVADISKAKSWGWKPQVGWKEGVSNYERWFQRCR
jgi:UDP-glucose 4-epimerase